jgi:cystathionine beta-lyase
MPFATSVPRRPFVTVVSGVPRSGTSLLMQMLAAGGIPPLSDGARVPDRDNPRGYLEDAAMRRLGADPGAAGRLRGAVGRVVKLVHVALHHLPAGPAYRVLLVERDAAAVLASQDAMLERTGRARGGLPPERLAEVYREQLLACRAALDARADVIWLALHYESVLRDPAGESARIAAFLGSGLDVAAMAAAVDPALCRQGGGGGYTGGMSRHSIFQAHPLGPVRFEVEHRRPGPEGGPTLRVRQAADGRELLRFDAFASGAHWHLDPSGRDEVQAVPQALDALEWTVETLRRDLPGLLRRAGLDGGLPDEPERERVLGRVEASLRNPPPDLDGLDPALLRERRGEKWSLYPADVLPLWVADMDFAVAEPIHRRLQRCLDLGDLGYPRHPLPTGLPELFAERAGRRDAWQVDPRRVELLSEVVQGIYVALEVFSRPGDGVIVQTPIYPPFLGSLRDLERRLVECPLRPGADGFAMDLEELAEGAAGARMLLLCNPHNPTGRAFRRDELEGIARIAVERDLVVVSDEIHGDLVHPGRRHVPLASLSPEIAARTITLTAASKAFNIAGLRCALAVFGSDALRRRFLGFPRHLRGGLGGLGIEATLTAWRHADPWLEEVRAHLQANRDFVAEFVAQELPGVRHHPPEATYLAWLECRDLDLSPSPYRFFLDQARVALSDGASFGTPGQGYVRINFATSRPILAEALERMAKALRATGR